MAQRNGAEKKSHFYGRRFPTTSKKRSTNKKESHDLPPLLETLFSHISMCTGVYGEERDWHMCIRNAKKTAVHFPYWNAEKLNAKKTVAWTFWPEISHAHRDFPRKNWTNFKPALFFVFFFWDWRGWKGGQMDAAFLSFFSFWELSNPKSVFFFSWPPNLRTLHREGEGMRFPTKLKKRKGRTKRIVFWPPLSCDPQNLPKPFLRFQTNPYFFSLK